MISKQLKITLYTLSVILFIFLVIIILTLTPVLPNWFGSLKGSKSNDSKSSDSKLNEISLFIELSPSDYNKLRTNQQFSKLIRNGLKTKLNMTETDANKIQIKLLPLESFKENFQRSQILKLQVKLPNIYKRENTSENLIEIVINVLNRENIGWINISTSPPSTSPPSTSPPSTSPPSTSPPSTSPPSTSPPSKCPSVSSPALAPGTKTQGELCNDDNVDNHCVEGLTCDVPNNVIVGVGKGNNTMAYSTDGNNWTGLGKSIFSEQGNRVACNNKMFVAVGKGKRIVAGSYDGINWTKLGLTGNGEKWQQSLGVAWSKGPCTGPNGRWVIINDTRDGIAYSLEDTDGNVSAFWALPTGGMTAIAATENGKFMTISIDGTSLISCDGGNWYVLGHKTNLIPTNDMAYGDGKFVAVGGSSNLNKLGVSWYNGKGYQENSDTVLTQSDPSKPLGWIVGGVTGINQKIINVGYGIAYGKDKFVMVGKWGTGTSTGTSTGTNTIYYSTDGINWTPSNNQTIFSTGRGITWVGNKFVAFGDPGIDGSTIAYSYDGINWTRISISENPLFVGYGGASNCNSTIEYRVCKKNAKTLGEFCYGDNFENKCEAGLSCNSVSNKIVVGLGNGTNSIAYSTDDGNTWIGLGKTVFTLQGNRVAAGKRRTEFVAVGESDTGNKIDVAYSPDGKKFTYLRNMFGGKATGVAYFEKKDMFIVTGDRSAWNVSVANSARNADEKVDGWSGLDLGFSPTAITVSDELILIVGGKNQQVSDSVFVSNDAKNWGYMHSTGLIPTNDVAWGAGKFVAVGGSPSPASSPSPSPSPSPSSQSPSPASSDTESTGVMFYDGKAPYGWSIGKGGCTGKHKNYWQTINGVESGIGYGITYGNDKFVMVGRWGTGTNIKTIYYSSDGINWTPSNNQNIFSTGRGVTWVGNKFVAFGEPNSGGSNMAYSYDGINWVIDSNSPFMSGYGGGSNYYTTCKCTASSPSS